MSLQLALTQLESLAELLNERKREAEQTQAFKDILKSISGKLSTRPLADVHRVLLRQDDVTQLVSALVARSSSKLEGAGLNSSGDI